MGLTGFLEKLVLSSNSSTRSTITSSQAPHFIRRPLCGIEIMREISKSELKLVNYLLEKAGKPTQIPKMVRRRERVLNLTLQYAQYQLFTRTLFAKSTR